MSMMTRLQFLPVDGVYMYKEPRPSTPCQVYSFIAVYSLNFSSAGKGPFLTGEVKGGGEGASRS